MWQKIANSRRRREWVTTKGGQPGSQELRIEPNSWKETDRPSAKTKSEPNSSSIQQSSLEQIPIPERIWRDVQPDTKQYSTLSHDVSKKLITLLRQDQNILREEDGAVEFRRLKKDINANCPHSVRWSNYTWINNLGRGGGRKKRFQFCTNPNGTVILYFRAIHGHSGETTVDPTLLDNVLIPKDLFQFIYHVRSYLNMHSIIASGLIAGGKVHGRVGQTVFFAAVDPMEENLVDQEGEHDMSQPGCARYKHVWKVARDGVYWVGSVRAQRMGLKFYQTRSNAIILRDTLPPTCIERVVSRKNREILYTRISKSRRLAHTIRIRMLKNQQ